MDKIIKKMFIIVFVSCVIVSLKIIIKIIINQNFVNNYPNEMHEYSLKLNSFINLYEPYILHYNYGNYYYQMEKYNEAKDEYLKALEYDIPDENVCKVKTNLALSLLRNINQNEIEEKKEVLEQAQKYVSECLNIDINNHKNINISTILFIIIIIMISTLVILTILIKKRGKLLPKLHLLYLKKLEELLVKVTSYEIDSRDAYMRMSQIIREFIQKSIKVNVTNLSKNEISKIGLNDLAKLMDEYYLAQFSKNSVGDVENSIKRTQEVIRTWNWK